METDSHRQVKKYYGKWIPGGGYRNVADNILPADTGTMCWTDFREL